MTDPPLTTLTPGPQSAMYFDQAVEMFHHASSSPSLWIDDSRSLKWGLDGLEQIQQNLTASNRRLQFLRSSVLFAALAAEAFANEFNADMLAPADADALDRLKTPDKLMMGIKVAGHEPPLERGAQPFDGLVELFRTRNLLVHPRPAGVSGWVHSLTDDDRKHIGPAAAGTAILVVADTMVACNALRRHPRLHNGSASQVAEHRVVLERYGKRLGDDILAVPDENEPGQPDIYAQMSIRATKRASRS